MVLGPLYVIVPECLHFIYYHEKPVESHLFTLFSEYRRLEILIHFSRFHHFLNFACSSGDSEIAIIVINESTAARDQAKKFLEDVRVGLSKEKLLRLDLVKAPSCSTSPPSVHFEGELCLPLCLFRFGYHQGSLA